MAWTASHTIPHAGLACLIKIVRVSSELLREDMVQLPRVRITVVASPSTIYPEVR
jgi:hypothetical protein